MANPNRYRNARTRHLFAGAQRAMAETSRRFQRQQLRAQRAGKRPNDGTNGKREPGSRAKDPA